MIFVCPKCKGKLNITESGAARCAEGHSYDRSRYGYYNLLLESGGNHGDNREMILARREFLSRGHYEPLAARIAEICEVFMPSGGFILDAGCGEGYYTALVRERALARGARVAAFDISKDAVREAAKRRCADDYAVAGSYHMPIASETIDILINTFSPMAIEETRRVLKSGGRFVMAIPGEEHLYGLKAAIYDTPYKNTVADTELDGFTLVDKVELRYEINLNDSESIRSLFMMTPYAYRTSKTGRDRILSRASLSTDAHFFILVYEKK